MNENEATMEVLLFWEIPSETVKLTTWFCFLLKKLQFRDVEILNVGGSTDLKVESWMKV